MHLRFLAGKNTASGQLRIGVEQLEWGRVGPFSAEIVADLDDERLTGKASAKGFGTVGATCSVTLAGSPMHLSSLKNATGSAEVQLTDADLALLDGLLPTDGPLAKLEGRGYAKLEISRANKLAKLPNFKVTGLTRGLAVVRRDSIHAAPRFERVLAPIKGALRKS